MSGGGSGQSETESIYWRMLLSRDPVSLCRRTLAAFDPGEDVYLLRVVDLNYKITRKTQTIVSEVTTNCGSGNVGWEIRLLTLAYLTGATETPLTGKWVSPVEFSGGDLFFSSDAHNLRFTELLSAFKSPEDFLGAGRKAGASKHTVGDASFVLTVLPRIPILFIYWAGDEELPSRISVLVDESARGHLAIDGLWLAIKISEKRLLEIGKS